MKWLSGTLQRRYFLHRLVKSLQINRQMSKSTHEKVLKIDDIHSGIKIMEYAPRGPIMVRAGEIDKELQSGVKKPFKNVIRANLGDAHAIGQKPITFVRQVLALATYPKLFDDKNFPEDAKKRAKAMLQSCGGSVGAYTESAGIEVVRRDVAKYIEKRDNVPCDWQNIVLSSGATFIIKKILQLLNFEINGKKPGIMVPIPQYPLYSATITEFGMHQIDYYLNEEKNWGLNISELQRAVDEARKVSHPRALVVINPGNPTGQVLTKDNIKEIIKFAHKERLLILADEVYQENVFSNVPFYSFKKISTEMGAPYSNMEIASFVSVSKGYLGECGLRGGYVEIFNICPKVKQMLFKAISVDLCPPSIGQMAVGALANPPQEGEPSYEQFLNETNLVIEALKAKGKMVVDAFNKLEGFSCNPVQGAMYAFPQIKLPPKAFEAAKQKNLPVDAFYAFELLETEGICIVPGSGFGQKPGTYHIRTTLLPPVNVLKIMLEKFNKFHKNFMSKYS